MSVVRGESRLLPSVDSSHGSGRHSNAFVQSIFALGMATGATLALCLVVLVYLSMGPSDCCHPSAPDTPIVEFEMGEELKRMTRKVVASMTGNFMDAWYGIYGNNTQPPTRAPR
ncbi:ORF27 [Ranid herpesvirus 2]|uniref:ORF27 n=1 Tax=Ranid herpesvirus 2 TaxID=389214 RepID=Q14W79_9VIRU|nr:ORF27 [Ranid herpesvirus 2]ABG25685.1 ORF27 [Ranid herpesvirus 2]